MLSNILSEGKLDFQKHLIGLLGSLSKETLFHVITSVVSIEDMLAYFGEETVINSFKRAFVKGEQEGFKGSSEDSKPLDLPF